ncbi:MAG: alpha/beta hydrolase family esterase [Methylocella sp.]|nr:MAG: phospholipase [Hyphomicrobiales bacterium]
MIVRGRKLIAFVLVSGPLAGACWLLLGFAGFPSAVLAAAGRVTIVSDGVPRTAILVQHRRLKQARRPAVIIMRGGREKGARLRRTFGFEEMARSSAAILIYPEPLGGHWGDAAGPEARRDSVFIHDLIGKFVARGIADRSKVFLVGIGTGGMMALRLACDEMNHFAGLAVIGASMPADLETACKPAHPLPLMMVAGTADTVVPVHGGKASSPHGKTELLSIDATLGLFGKFAGCAGGVTTTIFPNKDLHDGTRAYLDRLNNCAIPVEAVRIEGGGRALPGLSSEAGLGHGLANGDVNSAKLVWDFFRPLGG